MLDTGSEQGITVVHQSVRVVAYGGQALNQKF